MEITLSGNIQVPAPLPIESEIATITKRLVDLLKNQIENAEIESVNPIVYKRPLLQGGFIGLRSFGSGTISLGEAKEAIAIRYKFGTGPYWISAFWVVPCAFLFLSEGFASRYVWAGAIVYEMIVAGRLIYSLKITRAWLRATVLSLLR